MMTSTIHRYLIGILMLVTLLAAGWVWWHSGDGDPQNIKYVLWKAGFYKMDANAVVVTMLQDRHRDDLVIGRTKEELRQKFGNLLTLEQAPEYYRMGHELYWKNRDALFIPDSPWMIVFDHNRATDLVLMKGY